MKRLGLLIASLLVFGLVSYGFWVRPQPSATPIGIQSSVMRPDGAQIGYYSSGIGPRVLLLASLGRSVADFNQLAVALNEAGYRTIAVESRLVGISTQGDDDTQTDLFTLADDAVTAMIADGASGDDLAFAIGHAFGNRVARAVATRYPDNVGGLVLIAAGGAQKLQAGQRVVEALQNSFKWVLPPQKRLTEIKYAFFADENTVPPSWVNGWHASAANMQVAAVQRTSLADWEAAGGRAPMLVLQGTQDRIAPAKTTSDVLKASYPERVQVVSIGPAGHALLPEQPDQIAANIIEFLDAQTAGIEGGDG
ncbi:MAG: alpha/beta hydrolase [Robiginitomaculum sp.]|nr:MAG: alpha/beta hydrolase [Robiginitomaculum sp.]